MTMMDEHSDGQPSYIHIEQNEFLRRKHAKQKEEDISTCDCRYDASDPDSACGYRCLNLLTSTECTPGYCPCGTYCKNQRFQKCENAKSKLCKTEGRGWGLLADENIKAGQFIIEYCGEVISCKEAVRRTQAYERQGLMDAYIISLNANESIDATKKGSLARFINHSCQPNCETRKWNVLGEIRVGIFAKEDIPVGTELAYNYNFEWYGGVKVRCLCGAPCCSGFLGAKSRGFQEDTYLWEDDDDRYSVENIPTYDSDEDEHTSKLPKTMDSSELKPSASEKHAISVRMDDKLEQSLQPSALIVGVFDSAAPMGGVAMDAKKEEVKEEILLQHDSNHIYVQNHEMVSHIKGNAACGDYYIQTRSPANKKSLNYGGRSKHRLPKEVDAKRVAQLLGSHEAREEVYKYEEMTKQATAQLDSVYDEIRPAIEEHERDSQDSVSTNVAESWIEARCSKLKAEFDLHSTIIKNLACTPPRPVAETASAQRAKENDVKS